MSNWLLAAAASWEHRTAHCSAFWAAAAATDTPVACPVPNNVAAAFLRAREAHWPCTCPRPTALELRVGSPPSPPCSSRAGVSAAVLMLLLSAPSRLRKPSFPPVPSLASAAGGAAGRASAPIPCMLPYTRATGVPLLPELGRIRTTQLGAVSAGNAGKAAIGPRSARMAASSSWTCEVYKSVSWQLSVALTREACAAAPLGLRAP